MRAVMRSKGQYTFETSPASVSDSEQKTEGSPCRITPLKPAPRASAIPNGHIVTGAVVGTFETSPASVSDSEDDRRSHRHSPAL